MNKFVLFFISATMTVSSVSAGSIRGGVSQEESVASRDLQSFDSLQRWMSTCESQILKSCTGQSFVPCTNCIFAQSLFDSPTTGLENCAEFFCNDCEEEVMNFFECGTSTSPPPPAISTPVEPTPPIVVTPSEEPSPIVSEPTVPTSPIVSTPTEPTNSTPAVPIGNTTSLGCPFIVPENGASCAGLIPSPFLYQTCYYREYICDCRADAPQYLCAERVFTAKPTPTPTAPPTPAPTAPPTPVVVATCSDDVDIVSGTPCATIGLSCCVNESNQCTCGSDNFFVCQPNNCGVEEFPPVTLPEIDSTPVEEEPVIEEAPDEDDSPSLAKPEDIPIFDTSFFSISF